ncbi:MAG: DUF3617 family protein [Gammaproteobacteria bacterium]|nr:DUF3617 family protein [Gammaproteobacteria bacterium]
MNGKAFIGWTTALALTSALATAPLAAQPTGEEWEYQGNMDMMGMKMPVPPTKRCEKPDTDKTPPVESNCTVSDVQTQGNTTRFKIKCGPPEPMEGSGTTTRTNNRVDMSYTFKTSGGEMLYTMTGKKLGACTP